MMIELRIIQLNQGTKAISIQGKPHSKFLILIFPGLVICLMTLVDGDELPASHVRRGGKGGEQGAGRKEEGGGRT